MALINMIQVFQGNFRLIHFRSNYPFSDEYGHSSKLCSGWTPSRIRWNSTVNVSKIATTGTNAPTDDSLLVTGDGHGDGQSRNITQCSDVPLKTWNSKEMTNLEPKNQSSPKPKKSSRPPSRVGTPSRAVTPSILKSPNGYSILGLTATK